jgi:hypothetical protein
MMEYWKCLKDDETELYNKRGNKWRKNAVYSDAIYTFDIEVSNLFNLGGEWTIFDKSKPKEYYRTVDMIGLPYIWMFGINDRVYYGREFSEFEDLMKQISNEYVKKIIWVHNLAYEFQFLLNIFDGKYTIDKMVCRDIHKPISFIIPELNIEFRCSYMLTNLSLARAASEFTNIKKLDTLNYDAKVRTPKTELSDEELLYCEYDIHCLNDVIKYYKDERYNHIVEIPLTSTGEVRKKIHKVTDYYYVRKMQNLVPTKSMYMRMWACFAGGYTHPNILNSGRVMKNGKGMDICSSYPWQALHKLPSTAFHRCLKSEFNTEPDKWAYIALVKFKGVRSKYYTTYMQVSKCIFSDDPEEAKDQRRHLTTDNGRVVMSKEHSMWLTSIDYDIIMRNYDIDEVEVLEVYRSYLDYLDKRIINLILELYGNKTKLKGIKEKESIYKRDKAMLNSIYGMCVTNPLKQSSRYKNGWVRDSLTDEFIKNKLTEMKASGSTLMFYGAGLWITALARKQLFDCLLPEDEKIAHEFDTHTVYSDTDSIKYVGDFDYIFDKYNKKVLEEHKQIAADLDLDLELFAPKDIKGISHPIGVYELDSVFEEFLTLGAKKYVVREDGELHLTLSGVRKSGVTALNNDIRNFKNGFVFDYDHSGKLTHLYTDQQPEVDIIDDAGNVYHSTNSYGVVLYPTTYTIGQTDLYEALIEILEIYDAERRQ